MPCFVVPAVDAYDFEELALAVRNSFRDCKAVEVLKKFTNFTGYCYYKLVLAINVFVTFNQTLNFVVVTSINLYQLSLQQHVTN